jgi:hypothetical protein
MTEFLRILAGCFVVMAMFLPSAVAQEGDFLEGAQDDSLNQSAPGVDSTNSGDTLLSAASIDTTDYEKRFFSLDDSLAARFLIGRFNLRQQAERSFGHDAGDFFRSSPAHFIIEDRQTPFRKTVSPFGLPGNRINAMLDSRALNPLEHLPEPDNQIDFDDIPDAPANEVYAFEGPLGLAFGGENTLSSLIMIPPRADSGPAESRLVVQKGAYGYANTKAVLSEHLKKGRSLKAALEYRKAAGDISYAKDDAYHQWGEVKYPLRKNIRLNLMGRLYNRTGDYVVQPYVGGMGLTRFRRDRDLSAGLEISHSAREKSSIEFRHQRSESNVNSIGAQYNRNLDVFDNRLIFSHDLKVAGLGIKTGIAVSQERYYDGAIHFKRHRGLFDMKFLAGDSGLAFLSYMKVEKVGGFNIAPTGALILARNLPSLYFAASVGYSTKLPRQYELDLTPRMDRIIDPSNLDYFESGNPSLNPEKQLCGNLTVSLGKVNSDFTLSLAGGKIFDGIDWQRSRLDSGGFALNSFRTGNEDIIFGNISAIQRITLGGNIFWSGGASYRYVEVDKNSTPPYSPDYQGFSCLELQYYVRPLEIGLYSYIEVVYTGPYYGFNGTKLGEKPVINLKLSFQMKRFRFFYIFQDIPSLEYASRENYTIEGRFNFYGFTWDFTN